MVATDVLLLLHTPPVDVVLIEEIANWHNVVDPVIAPTDGVLLTVTVFVAIHAPGIA